MKFLPVLLLLGACAAPPVPAPPPSYQDTGLGLVSEGPIALSPSGRFVALFPEPKLLAVHSTLAGSKRWSAEADARTRPHCYGSNLWVATQRGILTRFEVGQGEFLGTLPAGRRGAGSSVTPVPIGMDDHGDLLLAGKSEIEVYIPEHGRWYQLPRTFGPGAISKDGHLILSLGDSLDTSTIIGFVKRGDWKLKIHVAAPIPFKHLSGDAGLERVVLAADRGDGLWIFRPADQVLAKALEFSSITALAVSPDGSTLAVGVVDGRVLIHDFRTLRLQQELPGEEAPQSLALSRDGGVVAWLDGKAVRIWKR